MIGIADADIGGAYVARTFTSKGRQLKRGDHLGADEVLSIPIANRRALADAGYINIYPKRAATVQPRSGKDERFVIMTGKNEFGVIEGRKINDRPLSKEAAEKLAAH